VGYFKIHRTLRMSPYGRWVTDRLWDVNDLVALWESYEQRRAERAAWCRFRLLSVIQS